jgi:hypothetical protein
MSIKQTLSKYKLESIGGVKHLVLLIVPFLQLTFSLLIVGRLKRYTTNWFVEFCVVGFSLIAAVFLLWIFFRIARKWLKIVMSLYVLFFFVKLTSIYGDFDTKSIAKALNNLTANGQITVILRENNGLPEEIYIDLEKRISAMSNVDSLFIYSDMELDIPEISFKVNDEICSQLEIQSLDVKKYADSIIASASVLSKECFIQNSGYRYKEHPLSLLGDFYIHPVRYKPEIFRHPKEDNKLINENEDRFVIYCSTKKEKQLRMQIESYFKDIPFCNVEIE